MWGDEVHVVLIAASAVISNETLEVSCLNPIARAATGFDEGAWPNAVQNPASKGYMGNAYTACCFA
jgi:hypothetical protein